MVYISKNQNAKINQIVSEKMYFMGFHSYCLGEVMTCRGNQEIHLYPGDLS